jgi:hypothetical protein
MIGESIKFTKQSPLFEACCGGLMHGKLAGVDDLYTLHGPQSGSRMWPAAGGRWHGESSLAWTTSRLHGPPSGSRLRPAAGGWRTARREARWRGRPLHCTDRHPAVGFGRLWGVGADDLCTAWTILTLHGPPTGSRLRPAAGV